MMVGLILLFIGYILIGLSLSLSRAKESIANEFPGEWDSTTFLIKCCFKWPLLLVNKSRR